MACRLFCRCLLNAAAVAKIDLSGLKMVIGGSALPMALATQALNAGIDIFAGYGMSETGPDRFRGSRHGPGTSAAIRNKKRESAPTLA